MKFDCAPVQEMLVFLAQKYLLGLMLNFVLGENYKALRIMKPMPYKYGIN
jgi:hypothetical protein